MGVNWETEGGGKWKQTPSLELMASAADIQNAIDDGRLTDEGGMLSSFVTAARAEVARRAQES